jgi:hypothetical protein
MLRLALAVVAAVGLLSTAAFAQVGGWDCVNEYIDCSDVSLSSVDTVRVVHFQGAQGDTVWMPVYMRTAEDTTKTSGFSIIIEYDANIMTPLKASELPQDSLYVAYQLSGELKAATERYQIDHPGAEIFSAAISSNPFDSGAIACGFNLAVFDTPEPMEPMSEVIFSLGFVVEENVSTGATAVFAFYQVNEYVVVDVGAFDAYCADCRRSNLSVDRWTARDVCLDSVPVIDSAEVPWDTTGWNCSEWVYDSLMITNATLMPTTVDGLFTVNPCPAPTILSWGSGDHDDSVGVSESFALEWSLSNSDSIVIYQGGGFVHTSLDLSGYTIVNAPATAGTYPYTLWTFSECDSVSATFDMLVGGVIPPDDPHAPQISVQSVYSIDVGATLNFSVQASDPDNDFVTLSATTVPSGATFPSVQGTQPVTGNFSWTPGMGQGGVTHSAVFLARDEGGLTAQASVSIIVNEPQYDKLFTSSVEGSSEGGIPGKTGILFPVNLVTSQTVYGFQFDFVYDADNFIVTGVDVTQNTADYIIYENIGVTPGSIRFIAFGMANEPIGSDGTEILMVEMEVASDATPGLYPVYIEDAWESINPDPQIPGLPLVSDSGIIMVDALGDVNLDVQVNVADLVSIVGYIIGDYNLNGRRFEVADIVSDGSVDVFDLVAVVNLIYGMPVSPSPGEFLEDLFATIALDYSDLGRGAEDVMTVRSELPVDIAAVQLELLYDPNVVALGSPTLGEGIENVTLVSHDDGNGSMKVVMFNANPGSGGAIDAGRVDLLEVPIQALDNVISGDNAQLRMGRALLSTALVEAVKVENNWDPMPRNFVLGQNYPNPFNPSTTIEFTLGAPGSTGGDQVKLNVYNILGQNVRELFNGYLPAGNHSIVWNGDDDGGQRVASGIYLYRLRVGAESQTKKMMLLK